jgi:hypothetical protein
MWRAQPPKGSGVTIDFAAAMPRYTLRRHVSHDLRELRRVMHARIVGMRAQRGNRAELDPLGHPGKRHGGYPGRGALRFALKLLKSRRKGANHAGAGCKPSANLSGPGLHLSH